MKAILVIDVDDVSRYHAEVYKNDDDGIGELIMNYLPFKPMPEMKSVELACKKEDEGNDYGAGMIVGWNDCINAIIGGTKGEK